MTSASPRQPASQDVRDRAVAWHVRLQSDAADQTDWSAFEAWLGESPEHMRAYEAVEAVWADLDSVSGGATTNLVSFRPRRRPAVWLGAMAASLVAAVVVGLTMWTQAPRTQVFDTPRGQPQTIALADGTRITLNGGSHLEATLRPRERRVVMADAEAAFDVAKDSARPFLIEVGDREIRVVGTEFNVLRHAGVVEITVRRGVVEVRPSGRSQAAPVARLQAGQALTHTEGRAGDRVAPADPEAAFAWTDGRLVFEGQRLADVAARLNRYVATPISVAPDAQDLPVTATLKFRSEDDLLRGLAAFLPVQAERQAGSVRLSLRR